MKILAIISAILILLLGAAPAWAQSKMSGDFTATAACPAVTSIHKLTNPGNVVLTVGTKYTIEGGNTANPTYYWIVVPTANPDHRWVPVTCGTSTITDVTPPKDNTSQITPTGPAGSSADTFVFAVSWEPAFCENKPDKLECQHETSASFEATHFALHGLWPEPETNTYCGYDRTQADALDHRDWVKGLSDLGLPLATRTKLDMLMPGTQSKLERHEWFKHGTCYLAGTDKAAYFTDEMNALDAFNSSGLPAFFLAHLNEDVDQAAIRAEFDKAFGPGAGQRVGFGCTTDKQGTTRRMHIELDINLQGDVHAVHDVSSLSALIQAAPQHVYDGRFDCHVDHAIIDPVGLQ